MENLFQAFNCVSNCIQNSISNLTKPRMPHNSSQNISFSSSNSKVHSLTDPDFASVSSSELGSRRGKNEPSSSKEELGRATWTFLHTLAAQYPDNPTRQQKKDVKELMSIMSRMYPCKECADHFKEILRSNPVLVESHSEFSLWLCHVHNVVNRSLGKSVFPCERVDGRWGKLECEQRACDVLGDNSFLSFK